jgi:pimeloyl-ACP methyl ester carboxylesterase
MPTAAGLYYFVHGEDLRERPPVLLLHGAGGSHLSWPPQIRRLSGQRIYTLDLPGHGKSEGIGKQDIAEYSKAIIEFMKAVGLLTAVIVGFSMGSAIALSLALQYRKYTLALGLIGGGAKMRVAASTLELAGSPSSFPAAVQAIVENSYSSKADSRLKELAVEQMMETRQAVLYGDLQACDEFDVMERVKKISIPMLLICGREDRMTPPSRSEYLRDQIEGAQLHLVDGAGHIVMLERPDEVAGLLGSFVDRIPY